MSQITPYLTRAEKYARFRWHYSDEAIRTILLVSHITPRSLVADLGAGTGILTRCFALYARSIYAVEPDPAMRQIAIRDLAQFTSIRVVDGTAEATSLPDKFIDLVTAAQSIHWFEPQAFRREMCRILKPGGWLAVLNNSSPASDLQQAIGCILTPQNGATALHNSQPPQTPPLSFYFGHDDFFKQNFPFTLQETWEEFIGSLGSASYAPDESHPFYSRFEHATRQVFELFCDSTGLLTVHGVTHLSIGQVTS